MTPDEKPAIVDQLTDEEHDVLCMIAAADLSVGLPAVPSEVADADSPRLEPFFPLGAQQTEVTMQLAYLGLITADYRLTTLGKHVIAYDLYTSHPYFTPPTTGEEDVADQ